MIVFEIQELLSMRMSINKYMKKITLLLLSISLITGLVFGAANLSKAQTSVEFTNIQVRIIDGRTVKIKWATNVSTTGRIIFGKTRDNLNMYIDESLAANTAHETYLANLDPESTYYYQIFASTATETIKSFKRSFSTKEYHEKEPPEIENVRVLFVSGSYAVITWETNENSTSWVEYGQNNKYNLRAGNNDKVKYHEVILRNLKGLRSYNFRVYSVDKEGNKSNYRKSSFTTSTNDGTERHGLHITYVRPNSKSDPNLSSDQVVISFRTNHLARGRITLSTHGKKDRTKNLPFSFNHEVLYRFLNPDTRHTINIYMEDIYNKNTDLKNYHFFTLTLPQEPDIDNTPNDNDPIINNEPVGPLGCDPSLYTRFSQEGYYGEYYNLPNDFPNVNKAKLTLKEADNLYQTKYFSFSRIENNLLFGGNYFPIQETKYSEDPFFFAAHWRAVLEVPESLKWKFQIKSDDDSWVLKDNKMTIDLRGKRIATMVEPRIDLSQGLHVIDIFFMDRGPRGSYMDLKLPKRIKAHPLPPGCTLDNYRQWKGIGAGGDDPNGVKVLGTEFTPFTPATALYRTPNSRNVYSIMLGQRHFVASPSSFEEYSYDWGDIRNVDWCWLTQYPRSQLLKSPDNPTVYYIYELPGARYFKIKHQSPTTFTSYNSNYWGNILTVTEKDIDTYPDIKLVKTKDDPAIYYLENETKHYVSLPVYIEKGFNPAEIGTVSQTHLDAFQTGEPLK